MTGNLPSERQRLADIASESWYSRGVNTASILYSAMVFARHWRGDRCLELGPAEGVMTEILNRTFTRLVVVEGSEQFAEQLRRRMPAIQVHCSLFEEFETDERFDVIVIGHVLEHVADPRRLLEQAAAWLANDGVICAAVPNARSVHRQAAVIMGLLETEHSLNDVDLHHGHRRVYDPESFRDDFRAAGLNVDFFGGYWLKPVSNAQLESDWSPEMVDAFLRLGERYPDIAAEIYVIARRDRAGAT